MEILASLLIFMPWIAALVIGFCLTQFNMRELRHSLWPGILLWLGVPILLAGLHFWMYKDGSGPRTEMVCLCGLLPLIFFLVIWPLLMKVRQKTLKPHPVAAPVPVLQRHNLRKDAGVP